MSHASCENQFMLTRLACLNKSIYPGTLITSSMSFVENIDLKTMITLVTIILSMLVATTHQQKEVSKPGPLYKLCGNDFIQAFQDCCEFGYPDCANLPVVDAVAALEKRGG